MRGEPPLSHNRELRSARGKMQREEPEQTPVSSHSLFPPVHFDSYPVTASFQGHRTLSKDASRQAKQPLTDRPKYHPFLQNSHS